MKSGLLLLQPLSQYCSSWDGDNCDLLRLRLLRLPRDLLLLLRQLLRMQRDGLQQLHLAR